MTEIAELSGVSIATVSRILNKNGRYSPETEKKVLDIIDRYGYRVNLNAKGLRTNKTQSIGVIVPDITNEFFAKIIRAIETCIIPKGYTVFVCDSNESCEMEEHHISSLAAKAVDGIIYISARPDVKQIYKEHKIPVVYIDRRPKNAGTLIISDNETGGFLATEELIRKGCRKIVMIRDNNQYSTVEHRYKGYAGALKKYGLPLESELVVKTQVSYKAAHDAVAGLLQKGISFDGVFCNNDLMAIGALHAVREAGLSIPQDVKLVGFDGVSLADICDPPLTTIRQNTDLFGQKSVETLLRMMEHKEPTNEVYVLPVELHRQSTT